MSAEANLYFGIDRARALTALVRTAFSGCHPGCAAPLPAIVYQRASTSPVTTIGNVTVAENIRFIITAWAETRTGRDAVAVEIGPALAPLKIQRSIAPPDMTQSAGYMPPPLTLTGGTCRSLIFRNTTYPPWRFLEKYQ